MDTKQQVKDIFKYNNNGLIELEFLNSGKLGNKTIYDYNVYFNQFTIYTIGKYRTSSILHSKDQRKWGFMYFDPEECKKINTVGIRVCLDYNDQWYRFTFMSEFKTKVFKNKYALRSYLKNVLSNRNIVKMPFLYENIKSDKTLTKIL